MKHFTSKRERKLWIYAFTVFIAIYATLFLGGQLINFMIERRILEQSTFYLFLVLVVAFIWSGVKDSSKKKEYWIYAGTLAVYGMAVLRMDLSTSERSHMFEYGLLSLLIYEALMERKLHSAKVKLPLLYAILTAGTIGLVDECIQYFITYRVFDSIDIGFNYFAATFAVCLSFGVKKLQHIFTYKH
ncbi:VanZ family protein [Geojedonia litorea]|uniref:VanZ family protein n=1 Tax=Geojedonia litorea TaxID=1268269 RepID=A0ABV9N8I7_9FLAO